MRATYTNVISSIRKKLRKKERNRGYVNIIRTKEQYNTVQIYTSEDILVMLQLPVSSFFPVRLLVTPVRHLCDWMLCLHKE